MSQGLVLFKTNADLDAEAEAAVSAEMEAEERARGAVETSLAAHIRRVWEVNRRHKEPIERRMLENLRQIAGRYSDEKANQIRQSGLPLIYMQITSVKCRAAKSWIRDVLMPAGDRPWSIKPTRIPDLPAPYTQQLAARVRHDAQQFMQYTGQMVTPQQAQQVFNDVKEKYKQELNDEAKLRADRMADEIEDQLIAGGWDRHFDDALGDVVDFPAGILKGPVMRRKKKLKWDEQAGTIRVVEEVVPEVERVDPFRFFPSPGMVEPDDGDTIELHDYSPDQIHDLIGLPGYNEQALRAVLRDHTLRGLSDWTNQALKSARTAARGEFTGSSFEENTIEALEFWGSVQGAKLLEWGKSPREIPDPEAMYDIMAVLIGQHVVCVRMNPDPLGRKPYSKSCFEDIPGAFWGKGVPDLIKDCQDVCNAAARSLVANMGISSGPQVAVNVGSLAPGETVETMYPWKIWQLDFTKAGNNSRPPIEFFQPNAQTQALMAVFKEFSSLADEYSGIPAYSYGVGNSVGGAGRTAAGLSMLMNAASKAIKNVIKHIDAGIIVPVIERYYALNMLWHPDQSIKGDAQVVARGAMSLVAKEQNQMRLQELLAQTNNEYDASIIGKEGRAELLRRVMQGADVGADDVVPGEEELRQRIMAEQQAAQQMMAQQSQMQGAPA